MGLIEIAGSILSHATERVELSAQNFANMTTPGYKARLPFASTLAAEQTEGGRFSNAQSGPGASIDFAAGKLRETGNALDLAISGSGFFAVRSGDHVYYTRNGQFRRDSDGRWVTQDGMALQAAAGDLTPGGANVTVLPDGTVLDAGEPITRLALFEFEHPEQLRPEGKGVFSATDGAAREMSNPAIRQGMLEESNVSTANEMLSIMSALRSAESGQRVVQVYDDIMARAISAFGQT